MLPSRTGGRARPGVRTAAGAIGLLVAVLVVGTVADVDDLGRVVRAVAAEPLGLATALLAYGAAFALRSWAWKRVLPGLSVGQAWAALHVSLLGNHVLPLRLGEVLRPASVARRTDLGWAAAAASTVTLRAADLLAVLALGLLAAPALAAAVIPTAWGVGVLLGLGVLALAAGVAWGQRLQAAVRLPGPLVLVATALAWVLEAAVVWQVARAAGVDLSPAEAVAVTAVTIAAQSVAVTPGGFGTYEAAATAALVAAGVDGGTAFAVALATHAVKTAYAVLLGLPALALPAPSYWGHLRLPRLLPPRPASLSVDADAPIVVMIPAHDEEATVATVVGRVPRAVAGRPVEVLVVDDGSTDGTAAAAAGAGATVLRHGTNRGLGAAVRRGLAESVRRTPSPAAVVYLDADAEYFPEDLPAVVAPVLGGEADYVVGTRFGDRPRRMKPHRRFGNVVLTRWVRWLTRRRDLTDGQSGFRAFSPAAAADAEVVHDYNYAQVLTLDLLSKGYGYAEVPITYAYRETGTSFVRLGRYLRRVLPAVHRELQTSPVAQSSTTWAANRSRAADHAASSREPSARSAVTAS